MKKSSQTPKIDREMQDLETLLTSLPDNPIAWAAVVKLVAPIVARLAVRLVLKKTARSLGEGKVNAIASSVAGTIGSILGKR